MLILRLVKMLLSIGQILDLSLPSVVLKLDLLSQLISICTLVLLLLVINVLVLSFIPLSLMMVLLIPETTDGADGVKLLLLLTLLRSSSKISSHQPHPQDLSRVLPPGVKTLLVFVSYQTNSRVLYSSGKCRYCFRWLR